MNLTISNGAQYPAWIGPAGIVAVVILIAILVVWLGTKNRK